MGRRFLDDVPLEEIAKYIDWTYFFSAWELKGKYPGILQHPQYGEAARELFANAQALLKKIVDGKLIRARGVHAFWPAVADGDDIIVYKDEDRREILATLPMLRQQEVQPDQRPNLSLADYIAPKGSGVPDYIGMFAVTGGIGAEELVEAVRGGSRRLQRDHGEGAGRSPGGSVRDLRARARARRLGPSGSGDDRRPTICTSRSTAASVPRPAIRRARITARSSICSSCCRRRSRGWR